jgi:uncharacterized membrane protein (DUF485 family)
MDRFDKITRVIAKLLFIFALGALVYIILVAIVYLYLGIKTVPTFVPVTVAISVASMILSGVLTALPYLRKKDTYIKFIKWLIEE